MNQQIENGIIEESQIESIKKRTDEVRFNSSLELFRSHNGIRPGELTSVISPKGQGKSALIKNIIADVISSDKTCYILLSEERADIYKLPLTRKFKTEDSQNLFLSRCYFDSMLNWWSKSMNTDSLLSHIEEQI